jgi:hypothetical protein
MHWATGESDKSFTSRKMKSLQSVSCSITLQVSLLNIRKIVNERGILLCSSLFKEAISSSSFSVTQERLSEKCRLWDLSPFPSTTDMGCFPKDEDLLLLGGSNTLSFCTSLFFLRFWCRFKNLRWDDSMGKSMHITRLCPALSLIIPCWSFCCLRDNWTDPFSWTRSPILEFSSLRFCSRACSNSLWMVSFWVSLSTKGHSLLQ